MSQRASSLLLFACGLLLGGLGGWALAVSFTLRGPEFQLTRDVPIRSGYGQVGTVPAGLRSGQQFDVLTRKGDVNYLRVYAVAFDRDLAGNTRSLAGQRAHHEAPWDQAAFPAAPHARP